MTRFLQLIATICLLTSTLQLFAQNSRETEIDSSRFSEKTITIRGNKFYGFLKPDGFRLMNSKDQICLKHSGDFISWKFEDFNKDGYQDIFLDKGGNTPERFDLLLYIPKTKSFRQVKDFENFPAPENISGTKYFYSYHKSGCADMNWDSDLFYINDFKAVRLANISGNECENSGIKDGIYISKVKGGKKILFKTLPISTIHNFEGYKWGFIKKYWTENYKLFL